MTDQGLIQATQKIPNEMQVSVRGNGIAMLVTITSTHQWGSTLGVYFLVTRLYITFELASCSEVIPTLTNSSDLLSICPVQR